MKTGSINWSSSFYRSERAGLRYVTSSSQRRYALFFLSISILNFIRIAVPSAR
jgi:hypothetical protein